MFLVQPPCVYAPFQHDTSRALDPQAHIRAIVANMTRMPDGKWKALDGQKLWANNTVIGSVYHGFLRAEMEKLGYKVEPQGKHGTFEIIGVPKAVVEAFSQRREAILLKAEQLGIVWPKSRDGVTVNTRNPKPSLTPVTMQTDGKPLYSPSWVYARECLTAFTPLHLDAVSWSQPPHSFT